jgi:alpha-N-arabinofuranosidase
LVNTGFGDAHSAAQEVEYVNGTPNTPMGQWRAENGRIEPWGVRWWGVGNEMFGKWQLGYMAVEQYALKHKDVERKMRQVDPTIKTIGVGEHGPWSEAMMQSCADYMDLVSEHFYIFKPAEDVAEHVELLPALIREKTDAHRRYRKEFPSLKGKDIRIAMDEWNYWYGPEEFGELGVRFFWKDAMGIAAGLHEYYRQSDIVYMANYAQTVNVIGCIKTTPTAAAFETAGLILKLYRQHYGSIPLKVTGAPEHVDVAAALTEDRSALTIGIVNPTDREQPLSLEIGSLRPGDTTRRYRMESSDPMALNNPGEAPSVDIVEDTISYDGRVTAPPYSVTLYVVDVQA